VIAIRNQKGEEVARQIIGIGAMQGTDLRTFDLSVDVFVPEIGAAAPVEPPAKTVASKAIRSSTVSEARLATGVRNPVSPPTRTPPDAPAKTPTNPPAQPRTPTKNPSGR
jgi:hypothetical protein